MNDKYIKYLEEEGFCGFVKMKDLINGNICIPNTNGVYMVLYIGVIKPNFLEVGTGGHFKAKDPNVSISILSNKWVDKAFVIYIGGTRKLKERIINCSKFGQGQDTSHSGGRYIWQIESSENLVVCWKEVDDLKPLMVRDQLKVSFIKKYGRKPFANIQ